MFEGQISGKATHCLGATGWFPFSGSLFSPLPPPLHPECLVTSSLHCPNRNIFETQDKCHILCEAVLATLPEMVSSSQVFCMLLLTPLCSTGDGLKSSPSSRVCLSSWDHEHLEQGRAALKSALVFPQHLAPQHNMA